ncbi:hypothetical protein BHE74_00011892 [Ensete ventricosum]|uniref:Uncharacterized protein n=1 Tax=Ensete ventricosum TaxID=4639 RepID=A0A426YPU3_ENSVE|nr:hypothetical protein B296_00011458 [Ensete ventricosum]RWW79800.1 hypothetical protein BHE74_00011892 [Ensete ventricosum]
MERSWIDGKSLGWHGVGSAALLLLLLPLVFRCAVRDGHEGARHTAYNNYFLPNRGPGLQWSGTLPAANHRAGKPRDYLNAGNEYPSNASRGLFPVLPIDGRARS